MKSTFDSPAKHTPATVTLVPSRRHPTECPSWCRSKHSVAASAPLQTTAHWSPQYRVENPQPLYEGLDVVLRAELFQLDERAEIGGARLYVAGETDMEFSADEADIFIGQMQAFVDTLRVMRKQMGAAA